MGRDGGRSGSGRGNVLVVVVDETISWYSRGGEYQESPAWRGVEHPLKKDYFRLEQEEKPMIHLQREALIVSS